MQTVKKVKFPNGLRLLLVPRPNSPTATALVLVEAGSEYETKRINGLSHFLEHMCFKGTTKHPRPGAISLELDALGAQSNAFTSHEYTGYWAKVDRRRLSQVLELVSDLYLHPIFNQAEIDKERGVIIEEINLYEDTPRRRAEELFTSLLYGNQPAGWDIAGHKENIRTITRADFLKYRAAHYIAAKTIVVVSGDFSSRQVEKQVREYFGSLPRRPKMAKIKTRESQKKPEILLQYKKSDQSHLVIGVRAFSIFDPRRYALEVLAATLGHGMSSRLFYRLREELGAAYYVNASTDLFLDHGYLAAAAGVDNRKLETVIRAIMAEFSKLSRVSLLPAELKKVKDHLIGTMLLNLETSDELANFYGGQEVLTGSFLPPAEIVRRLQKVSATDIRRVAGTVFTPARLNLAVIGPTRSAKALTKLLTFS